MIPVGANGDRAPAMAPWATMIAIRNAGMPARAAAAIAIGATSAAAAMLPAPIEASARARPKNITGISPALPRQHAHRRAGDPSRVPLTCACVNSSVTPTSVRNRSDGKPATTAFSPIGRPASGAR